MKQTWEELARDLAHAHYIRSLSLIDLLKIWRNK